MLRTLANTHTVPTTTTTTTKASEERGTAVTTATVDDQGARRGTSTGRARDVVWFPQKGRGERCRRDSAERLVTVDRGARTKASAILSRALAATRKVDGRRGAPRARRDGEGESVRAPLSRCLSLTFATSPSRSLSYSPSLSFSLSLPCTPLHVPTRVANRCAVYVRSPEEFTRR